MNAARHLAIRTGRSFTLVSVDSDANQCTVVANPKVLRRDVRAVVQSGTSERSIKSAACNGGGQSFRTLTALRASVEEGVEVERAREYDC
jgi:hypothetical protein